MWILSKYIMREHLGPFVFSIAIISSMLILNFLFQAMRYIVGKGLSFETIFQYIVYNLAWILVLVVPMSVLVSSIMAFGRLSSDNEITAMKASGISYLRLILPVILMSALVAYGLIEFNNQVLPQANHKARILKSDIKNKRPTLIVQPGVYLDEIEDFSMIVEEKNDFGSEIFGITIFDKSTKYITRNITAEKGKITINPKTESLILTLENGEIHDINLKEIDKYQRIRFKKHVVKLKVPNLVMKETDSKYYTDREKSTHQMREEVERYGKEVNRRTEKINQLAKMYPEAVSQVNKKYRNRLMNILDTVSVSLPKKDSLKNPTSKADSLTLVGKDSGPEVPTVVELRSKFEANVKKQKKALTEEEQKVIEIRRKAQQLNSNLSILASYQKTIDKLSVEIYKKYSIPTACIFFVLIGAALGIKVRKGGIGVAGGISLVFFILYYFCLVTGEDLADRQIFDPFWAMWSPNIVLGFFGIVLTYRTAREKSFPALSLTPIFTKFPKKLVRRFKKTV